MQSTLPLQTYSPSAVRRFHGTAWLIAIIAYMMSPYQPFGWFWTPDQRLPYGVGSTLGYVLLNITQVIAFGYALSFLLHRWKKLPAIEPFSKGFTQGFALLTALLTAGWWVEASLSIGIGTRAWGSIVLIEHTFALIAMSYGLFLVFYVLPRLAQSRSLQ